MRVEIEDKREELDECRNEVAKLSKRRIRYTKKFLLSISDIETCNESPSDFNSSIFSGLEDGDFNGLIESPRIDGRVSLPSSDRSGYGPSRSLICNSDGRFEELVNKWDGCSSWLKNIYSDSRRNNNPDNSAQESSSELGGHLSWQKNKNCDSKCKSDPVSERSYRDKYRISSPNPNKDGLLGAAAFPRVSGSTEAVSAPAVQVQYQLNKCDNPYRPPSAYKLKNDGVDSTLSSEKGSSATTLSDEQQNENQSVKQAAASDEQGEAKSIDAPSMDANTYAVSISSSRNVSEDLHGLSPPSLEAINKSEANIEKEITEHGTREVTVGIPDQKHAQLILEDVSDAIEVKSEISTISRKLILSDGNASSSTWNHPAKEHTISHVKVEQLDSATPAASSELNLGFSLGPHFQEVKPDEPAMSFQIGSFNPNRRRDTSRPCGTEFSDLDDDFLISLLNNSGAFEMCDEDIRVRKFSLRTEINEFQDDQSDYEEVWAQISSMLRLEQELMPCPQTLSVNTADSQYKHRLPDDDNSIQIDQTTVYDASKFDTSPVLSSKENPNHPASPNQKRADGFKNEICLPDEESLITIKDLITPLSLKELRNWIMGETDMLTAEVQGDETSTVLHLSPNHKHLEKSSPQSHKTKTKRGQAQLSSRINTVDPKTGQNFLPPPVCCSCSDKSWRSPPDKLKDYENTECYSVLDQPWNFPQQNQQYKGVTFPDLKNSHNFEVDVCSTYIYPLNPLQTSYQHFGRPAPDFGRLEWNNSQPTQGRFTGMDLEQPMHPFGISGYGQDLSILYQPQPKLGHC